MSKFCVIILGIAGLMTTFVSAQKPITCEYSYPVHQSSFNPLRTEIIIRPGAQINPALLTQLDLFTVKGSLSGTHEGELILATDNKTIIFKSRRPFAAGERVDVSVNRSLLNNRNQEIPPFAFYFTTTNQNKAINPYNYFDALHPGLPSNSALQAHVYANNDTLPDDFPEYNLTVTGQPADGHADPERDQRRPRDSRQRGQA